MNEGHPLFFFSHQIINGSLEQYYEAVYLMKTVLQHTPQTPESQSTRNLLEQKIEFYSAAASRLYFDDSSTAPFNVNTNPRSPTMGQQQFFSEERSVPPPPDPPVCESPRFTQSAEINRYASKANTKLSHAIDLDETGGKKQAAIDAYMAAAELYLQTIRISEQKQGVTSFTDVYKGRLEGVLDRIEQLKSNHDRQITKQPQSGYEHSQEPQNRVSSYTKKEILVLKRSSLIASGLFLPWSEGDARTLSLQVQKQSVLITLFTDKEGDLALSDKQIRRFHRWARPHEIVQMRKSFGYKQQAPTMIRSINPYTIRQAYVTDCSFIASLCICAAFEKRFRKRLITSIIYPQNSEGMPIVNPGGQYMVKLWLNGVARQVIIDDRLPIDKDSGLLCSHTTGGRNQMELWVTIIEKAYMKLCGGYDFPGSNSGVDLFSLTGWIPERIFFAKKPHKIRDFETARERAWERLFSANSFGDCLITVATSHDITEEKAETLGLVTGHAYAVLDVFQSAQDGTRLLQLKNPWASKVRFALIHLQLPPYCLLNCWDFSFTKGWRGKYSCHDLASWSNSLLQAEVGYNPELASEHDDGIFWISWDDVLLYFQNIQLSWNPALFPFCTKTHDFWPKDQGPMNDTFNVGENPQYVMILSDEALTKKATIWVLISRHVTKQEQEGAEVS